MLTLTLIVEQVINGLFTGAIYLLIALGLSLIFSLGGIVNLAHGAFYAIGAYLTILLSPWIGFGGSIVASPVLVGCLGLLIERHLFRRFYRADPILSLLLTFGLAMVAEQALRMSFGAPPLPYGIPAELRGGQALGFMFLPNYRAWVVGTSFGRVVRAGVQNPEMVGALGISLKPYMASIVMLGVGLAALAGVMLAPITGVHPAMGAEVLTGAFVVVVIGGLGSFWGVIAAALIVGVLRGIMVFVYPPAAEASVYALMAIILMLRPRGLFGERILRFE